MNKQNNQRKVVGMNVGSATLVMVFAVLCLTIFAILSVVTARSELSLAQKSADATSAYYMADSVAGEIYEKILDNYDGEFTLPENVTADIEEIDGKSYLNYYVPIDERQNLWLQLCEDDGEIKIVHHEVQETVIWEADQSLDVWLG